ncbi:hypothetical protein GCM10023219_07800 [Stakelama sediminis]|uniref:DUF2127 domain-containing protein n=1 Tax=Stakelama sediminis TaxID=463200 RepID=A0A840YUZ4_9SPHN|nr:hypothetical protein [Stakelama sediminis]MBB5717501.1 hypothetical protein [Stakelama sediminis]
MRPQSIVRFEIFYWLSFVVSIAETALAWNDTKAQMAAANPVALQFFPAMMVAGIAISLIITAVLWYFAARKASNVARWIVAIFYGIGLVFWLISLVGGKLPVGIPGVLQVVGIVLQTLAVIMLFRPDAKAWFEKTPTEAETTETFE